MDYYCEDPMPLIDGIRQPTDSCPGRCQFWCQFVLEFRACLCIGVRADSV